MKFCYELKEGFCGYPIVRFVSFAFCHYLIYGIFAVTFVFTNVCYPPFYYVDYMFGISGATLIGLSIFGWFVANVGIYQPIRFITAFIVLFNVLLIVVSTFYYTVERWNDVMVTYLVSEIRMPLMRDLPDFLWFSLSVFACINGPIMIFYMVYVLSFMCNSWKSNLLFQPFRTLFNRRFYSSTTTAPIVPPSDIYPINKTTTS